MSSTAPPVTTKLASGKLLVFSECRKSSRGISLPWICPFWTSKEYTYAPVNWLTIGRHCPNGFWLIANWTIRNKLQWNSKQNAKFAIQWNVFENVVKMSTIVYRPQCAKKNISSSHNVFVCASDLPICPSVLFPNSETIHMRCPATCVVIIKQTFALSERGNNWTSTVCRKMFSELNLGRSWFKTEIYSIYWDQISEPELYWMQIKTCFFSEEFNALMAWIPNNNSMTAVEKSASEWVVFISNSVGIYSTRLL